MTYCTLWENKTGSESSSTPRRGLQVYDRVEVTVFQQHSAGLGECFSMVPMVELDSCEGGPFELPQKALECVLGTFDGLEVG